MKRILLVSDFPGYCADVVHCTTSQSNAHVTDAVVLYSWHCWYQLSVTIEGEMTRNGIATFRCRRCDQPKSKARNIPQWMFDASVCMLMRQGEQALVSITGLKALVSLVSEINAPSDTSDSMVEDMNFQNPGGDSCHETTASSKSNQNSNPSVRTSVESASMEGTAPEGQTRNPE